MREAGEETGVRLPSHARALQGGRRACAPLRLLKKKKEISGSQLVSARQCFRQSGQRTMTTEQCGLNKRGGAHRVW